VPVTAAVGVALARPGHADVEELIAQAETAMREARRRGPGAHAIFGRDISDVDSAKGAAVSDLRRGLDAGELQLYYQLKVALDGDRIVGAEALLRWRHPDRGLVPPLEFIGIAEQSGLLEPIGKWVIGEACRAAAHWGRSFPERPALVVSVNISACQFRPELVNTVADALSASGIEPAALCLEITESLLMENLEGSAVILSELDALGIALSIDDFGTGFSSLARLKNFPLDELKIDKSFVDGLGNSHQDSSIVDATITLAHALGLTTTAEGVETVRQNEILTELGCDKAQGYLIYRPETAEAMAETLRRSLTPRQPYAASNTWR
jgi:EAL domain-containing protein (putative c-di-GMP-specific phosphodiesterase class I)